MPSWFASSPYLILILTLTVGALLGGAGALIFKTRGSNTSSYLAGLSTVTQAVSVAVALVTVIVSLSVSKDQLEQAKKQYTLDRLDKMLSDDRKSAIQASLEAPSQAIATVHIEDTMNKMKKEGNGPSGPASHYVEGKELNDKEYDQYIIRKTLMARDKINLVLSYIMDIKSCMSSGLCDEALGTRAACYAQGNLTMLERSLSDDGPLTKILKRNSSANFMDRPDVIRFQVEAIRKSADIDCKNNDKS